MKAMKDIEGIFWGNTVFSRIISKFQNIPVLMGTNADEGSKAAMNFLPEFFPNIEMKNPKLNKEEFDEIVENIFSPYPRVVS